MSISFFDVFPAGRGTGVVPVGNTGPTGPTGATGVTGATGATGAGSDAIPVVLFLGGM